MNRRSYNNMKKQRNNVISPRYMATSFSAFSTGSERQFVQSPSTVHLNVGGHHFETSIQTLTKDPNSMLAAMFSGRFTNAPSVDGSYFIDRDGTHFRYILNYLRTGYLNLPVGATFHEELLAEAEFYQIQGIIDELMPYASAFRASDSTSRPSESFAESGFPDIHTATDDEHRSCLPLRRLLCGGTDATPFGESKILTKYTHRKALKRWLPPGSINKWCLLFRASRDGFAGKSFHSKCDKKGATVTIVKCDKYIFGGYTEGSWPCGSPGTTSFLFSMINPSGQRPTKIPLKYDHPYSYSSIYGPSFGYGDLQISDNADSNVDSYSKLGKSYQCPPKKKETFFTGSKNFTVTDYEVFGLYK